MPRAVKPLTAKQVSQTKPKSKAYELSDGKGLMLRVSTTGSKTWLLKYYKPHSKSRTNLSLGSYPEITLAMAREKRKDAKVLLADGVDPRQHRAEQTDTFKKVTEQWLVVKRTKVSDGFADDIWRSLERHVFPELGDMPLDKLTAPLVIDVLKPVEANGKLDMLRRVCQRINEIMVFATNTGVIHHNPLSGIKAAFPLPDKENLPTLKPEQLPELLKAIHTANVRVTTRQLALWQLNTMARPSEASGAKWSEIDFEKALWAIPAERMKKKREHVVPLTEQTLEILESIKPISSDSEFIFPADRDKKKSANSQSVNMALKRMGFKGQLVAHGLRSLASTILNNQGFDADIIESALAHKDKDETRATYNRATYLERRKVMMAWWSDHIDNALVKGFTNRGKKNLSLVG